MNDEAFDRIDKTNGICATVATFYAGLYPELREAARKLGWALALHGSLTRDLDLLAVPWTEEASAEDELIQALVAASGGFRAGGAIGKPHGRIAVLISLGGSGGFIDLSLIPRSQ